MTGKNQTHDPLNVDEALVSSEAFLLKNKNVCSSYRMWLLGVQTFHLSP